MRKAALLLGAALAFVPGGAAAAERDVVMPGKFFSPRRLAILVGDTVTWRNADSATHDIVADDRSFDSGLVRPGGSSARTFSAVGTFPYHCSIHRYMRGEVAVFALALLGPEQAVRRGAKTLLSGLVPTAGTEVTLERGDADGRFTPVQVTTAAADGSFRFVIRPTEPAPYRASAGGLSSEAARVVVGADVHLTARRNGGQFEVEVSTDPAQAGAQVRLQVYARELFAWVNHARTRLNARSQARFSLSPRRPLHVRAVLPRGRMGYGRAVSPILLIRPTTSDS